MIILYYHTNASIRHIMIHTYTYTKYTNIFQGL